MSDNSLSVRSDPVDGSSARAAAAASDRTVPSLQRVWSALWKLLRREPLVHFAILGGLIFGADALLHPPVKDDHTITVTKTLRQSFIDNFDEDKARVPSDAE